MSMMFWTVGVVVMAALGIGWLVTSLIDGARKEIEEMKYGFSEEQ